MPCNVVYILVRCHACLNLKRLGRYSRAVKAERAEKHIGSRARISVSKPTVIESPHFPKDPPDFGEIADAIRR